MANGNTMLTSRGSAGVWSAPQPLIENFEGQQLSLAVDQSGTPQVIQRRGGGIYHHTGRTDVTKHHYAPSTGSGRSNGQRLASRVDGEVYYLLGDHLGSTTVVAGGQGAAVGYVLYDPYGEVVTTTLPPAVTERLRIRDRPNP